MGRGSTSSPEEPDESEALWKHYSGQPDQRKLRALVTSVQPTIDKAIASYVGTNVPPTLKDHARLMAIDAIERYSPQPGKSLKGFVMSTLQGLKREAAKVTQPFVAPPDMRQDNAKLYGATQQLANDLGREPTDEEVQHSTGFSIKRITKMRKRMHAQIPLSGWEHKFDDDEGDSGDIATQSHTPFDDWTDAVYHDLGSLDRLIMQYRSGYRGMPVLSNQDIAKKLNLTPMGVSMRAKVIQLKLDQFNG